MKESENVVVKITVIHSLILSRFLGKIPTLEFLLENSVIFARSMSMKFPTTGLICLRDILRRAPTTSRNKGAKLTDGESFSH